MGLGNLNPKATAEQGERIYREKYQTEYEARHLGKFVVIDVKTEEAYLGDSPEDAFNNARNLGRKGPFHLIKVGSPGAYRVSHATDAKLDWIFQ